MSQTSLDQVLTELLDCDHRPTFVVQLSPPATAARPTITFVNSALRTETDLHDAVLATTNPKAEQFWDWILGGAYVDTVGHRETANTFLYNGSCWTRSVLHKRWVIVGYNEQYAPNTSPRPVVHQRERSHSLLQAEIPNAALGPTVQDDWAIPSLTPQEEEPFVLVVNSLDWSATPLGPISQWPPHLQQTFNQVLADSRPIVIYWGPKLTVLYNEAFSKLCGVKHPSLLGKSVDDAWPDFCEKIKHTINKSSSERRASSEEEWCFFIERADGMLEETYLKWSIVPIMQSSENEGYLQPVHDTTSMRLWERRMGMLIDLGNSLVTARDVKSYWAKTVASLEACNPGYDIPLAVLYSVEDNPDASCSAVRPYSCNKICHLEGSLGVPKNHALIPQTLFLERSTEGLSFAFREALKSETSTVIRTRDETFPTHLLEGLLWRGFKDPCHEAIICPIRPTKDEHVMGLLVLGLNPRRPFDDDYQQSLLLLDQKLATSLASTVLFEEEARRVRNTAEQAAYDRAKLREKLAVQTKEANEWVSKFEAVAEFIPVGMCFGNSEGLITFANDAWHRITGVPKTSTITQEALLSRVVKEDQNNVARAFTELERTGAATIEFRVHRDDDSPLQRPIGSSPAFEKAGLDFAGEDFKERYISAAMKAETTPEGTLLRVLACMTDVTLHKRAADEAIRRAQQADNLKRMADSASVGMYEMRADGQLIWANNSFFEMCGLQKVDLTQMSIKPFQTCVIGEDLPLLRQTLDKLVSEGKSQSTEIRFNTPWVENDGSGNKVVSPRCILAMFMPVETLEGVIETFTGCLVDMTLQRWQFEMERKRKDEAIESKRQQERFIDMTSHEMRNPLSAISQCADSIVAHCSKAQELIIPALPGPGSKVLSELMVIAQNCIDDAETIDMCTRHQRYIVDEILTVSKMDSNLLTITPTTVNPTLVAREAFKMFELEARRVDINLSMRVDQTYDDLKIDFLDLDPARLRQILINLITNALKFSKNQQTRNVTITLSASKDRPTDEVSSVEFLPRTADSPPTAAPPPGSAGTVYLSFEVKDTGQGLTKKEKSSLFQRFVQASPKTHVKYGGSGLGLFISKRLVEMLGGAIGVASEPSRGSTFAFYIAASIPGEEALQEARAAVRTVEPTIRTPTNTMIERFGLGFLPRIQAAASHDDLIRGVLIVEDNLINQQITRRGLLDKGYKVEVANHGLEALDKLKMTSRMNGEFPLSVIMMDMEMPIQDGLTCTRNIRQLEQDGQLKGPRIPIIAVSANARPEQIEEAKRAGCDDVLVKPYKIPELVNMMQKVVRQLEGGRDADK